eukprot:354314-Chlamydomonas_euryale.AAC.22
MNGLWRIVGPGTTRVRKYAPGPAITHHDMNSLMTYQFASCNCKPPCMATAASWLIAAPTVVGRAAMVPAAVQMRALLGWRGG